jgi:hypothetical protein
LDRFALIRRLTAAEAAPVDQREHYTRLLAGWLRTASLVTFGFSTLGIQKANLARRG